MQGGCGSGVCSIRVWRRSCTPSSKGNSVSRQPSRHWYADNVLSNRGGDRTLQPVFTQDHFGPSKYQQAGLSGSLMVELEGSVWHDSETGDILGQGRQDGGPTSLNL